MSDIFDHIEWKVRDIFGGEPACAHVGDVKECDIKRHPTYSEFRAEAISAGVRSASTSRLWESLIAMGRLCDLDGDDTWRLVILDCIVPYFRSLSARISRDFHVECEDIRSAMVATALEVWDETVRGVAPRHVRDRMVKAAFEVAFRLGSATSSEYSMDDVEIFVQPEGSFLDSTLKASSIIDASNIHDADVAEQLRGERIGELFQLRGCSETVRDFHDELRTGTRSGSINQTVRTGLSRSWFSDPNLYYYVSDLYPSFIGLREAADVMDIAESAAYRLIRAGQFPFPAARAGRGYKISVKALMLFKSIPNPIVHVDDVENGALHAGGAAL
ncbi:helix-turn-helix domain-containing protein [Streptomyces uncialis]|uniref:helix-turn-helix domain-containing protein n=1 Tax=Streptomyces uncialis TaxID=1048205 RepID=UPI000B22BB28|nr:helix-turn-helix domain-containing protein [Streptomyces uncialis]